MTSRSISGLIASLAIAAAVATCDGGPAYDCSPAGRDALYERRIAPLFAAERPSSCNQCHLSGIDLGIWQKASPCQTMACLAQEGLVDLDDPERSLVLAWIDRAVPDSTLVTAEVIAEERAAFLDWIRSFSACGACVVEGDPCLEGEAPGAEDCKIHEADPDSYALDDPGDCSDRTLEAVFQQSFFPWRQRCYPCHFDGFEEIVPDAPKWIGVGPCDLASLSTFRRVTERGYLDADDPDASLWILKPLEEALGGVDHGGGPKFHDEDEDALVAMRYFAGRWAGCQPD